MTRACHFGRTIFSSLLTLNQINRCSAAPTVLTPLSCSQSEKKKVHQCPIGMNRLFSASPYCLLLLTPEAIRAWRAASFSASFYFRDLFFLAGATDAGAGAGFSLSSSEDASQPLCICNNRIASMRERGPRSGSQQVRGSPRVHRHPRPPLPICSWSLEPCWVWNVQKSRLRNRRSSERNFSTT